MSTSLKAIPFEAGLLPLVEDFDCCEDPANPRSWEDEINRWIRMEPENKDGALYYIGQGTQVWLYVNDRDDVIGYSSLCGSNWPDPEVLVKVPKLKRIPITLIPAVGIGKVFQGGPDGARPDERYSTMIMNHLVFQARQHSERQPYLCLHVHPENARAIRLYCRMGFVRFHKTYHHPETAVDYPSYILKLANYHQSP